MLLFLLLLLIRYCYTSSCPKCRTIFLLLLLFLLFLFCCCCCCSGRSDTRLGPHKRIGTCSFTIPVITRKEDKQQQDEEQDEVYQLTVQAWYPLNHQQQEEEQQQKHFNWFTCNWISRKFAVLWTSGNSLTQQQEAVELLRACAESSSLKPFLLKHLCLATTSSEVIL